ncbi:lipopolysaccharide transport periplasmic protein LptA [Thioalkalivibrio sp. HK1]|uniref:lipopolysaccharide transport periplasmic protein LptA n=1 Tax=Thioalkalivibrio sp. HK1 TaxID=1469245 RepID=UPI0004BA93FB|nr:lipopolysaccharide transport periplasmic protein LptA [Thioalkalivibrio sp. HK1]
MNSTAPSERIRPPAPSAAKRISIAAILWILFSFAFALSTDSNEPITIEANRAERDNRERMMVYEGDVIIEQGTLRILGERVVVHFDANDRTTRMIATGTPAHIRQLPEGADTYREAWANEVEYRIGEEQVVLTGQARYEEGGDQVRAERLVYDVQNSSFRAFGNTDGTSSGDEASGRVRITIDRRD